MKSIFSLLLLVLFSNIAFAEIDPIYTDSTTRSTVHTTGETTTTIKSPPPSAVAPNLGTSNSDICTIGISGAVQTQILGLSAGSYIRDFNCERLKNAKTLYDMGMKVAAVSVMCQDKRIFDAMMNAGTPCPYDGMIGDEARDAWKAHENAQPQEEEENEYDILRDKDAQTLIGAGSVAALLLLLL